jgi:hypothetical protein
MLFKCRTLKDILGRADLMADIYDPERLLAQAMAWRAAAEKVPLDQRDIYLSQALAYENRVERSINTPVIKDRLHSNEFPADAPPSTDVGETFGQPETHHPATGDYPSRR